MRNATADWRSRAACLTADPELFFPLSAVGPSAAQLNQAKMICAGCQVRPECLSFALRNHQVDGVWGGTSEEERRRLLAGRRTRRPAPSRRLRATAGAPR